MSSNIRKWMYIKDGKPVGPISQEDILNMLDSGELTSHDLVAQKGDRSWVAIKEHNELKIKKSEQKVQAQDQSDKHWVLLLKKPPHRGEGYTQKGPFDKNELVNMVKSGEAAFTDYAWRPGYSKWTKITHTEMFSNDGPSTQPIGDEELPDIPVEDNDLLQNVVVQKNKSFDMPEEDKNDLVKNYENEKKINSMPSVPEIKTDSQKLPEAADGSESQPTPEENKGVQDDQGGSGDSEDVEFENLAPIINTTTQAFKDLDGYASTSEVSKTKTKSKSKKKKRKKTRWEKILGVKKKKKKPRSSKSAMEDFKSWRDEEAFLKSARKNELKKTIAKFIVLGSFGLGLFFITFFLIVNFMNPKKERVIQPNESTVAKSPVKPRVEEFKPKADIKVVKSASFLKIQLTKENLIFYYDQFRNPTISVQIFSSAKKTMLPKGFHYQNLLQVKGGNYQFSIKSFIAGEYIVKAQLDEQQVESSFVISPETLTEKNLEWVKKRKSHRANMEKYMALEASLLLYKLSRKLDTAYSSKKTNWNKFYKSWKLSLDKVLKKELSKQISKINGPNDLIYIKYWINFQSKYHKLEQFGNIMNSQKLNNSNSVVVDTESYKSLYESARQLSQW